MKKSYQKISVLMVCFLLLLSVVGTALAVEEETVSEEFLRNQYFANEAYNKLLIEFGAQSDPLEGKFPEFYGGGYVDEDGNLVICLKEADEAQKAQIYKIIESYPASFVEVDNSYNELLNIRQIIKDGKEELKSKGIEVKTFGIDEINNRVNVGIKESQMPEEDIYQTVTSALQKSNRGQIFSTSTDIGTVLKMEFVEEDISDKTNNKSTDKSITEGGLYTTRLATLVKPGIEIDGGLSDGSVGFYGSVIDGGVKKYGFFTAAHVTDLGDVVKDANRNRIGETILRGYGSSVDAAFVETDGYDVQLRNIVGAKTIVPNRYITPAPGSVVGRIGAVSDCYIGEVERNDGEVITESGVTLTGMIFGSFQGLNGDSGGLVYIDVYDSNGNATNQIKVVGIFNGLYYGQYYATKGAALPWNAWPE